jgi:putative DNA base modification enzyme with NMAD domain
MSKLYSYVIKYDAGSAPNPFWGTCTLAICKPAIRRTAQVGDWVIGTGSKNSKCNDLHTYDLSDSIIYAMKVTRKLTMQEYDQLCITNIPQKIPIWKTKDWRHKVGDSIYDYSQSRIPSIRRSVHDEGSRKRDLGGLNVLLSNHFYYFGEEAQPMPPSFKSLIAKTQGHLINRDEIQIEKFEQWISRFRKNKIYADSQRRWAFDKNMTKRNILKCKE